MEWIIEDYETPSGQRPVREFFTGIQDPDAKAAALALIRLLKERGNTLREPQSKALGDGLFELRQIEDGVRVFYTFKTGPTAVLLGGLIKKRGSIPANTVEELRTRVRKIREAARAAKRRDYTARRGASNRSRRRGRHRQ